MAGTVSFKVYVSTENEPSKKEVRRFGVEADVVTNFDYLREKMQSIFPSLRRRHFTVSWKDADGDDVTISSNEELQIALDETSMSNIRRLHVILHSEYETPRNSSESQPNASGPIHVGVSCDGCDKQVQGFRYKCIQCADYDLCVDCESNGMHPEHCMIRLAIPLQWKPHYGRRLATQVNRFVRKAQSNACKDEEPKQHCPFKSGKHHGKSRHGADSQSWIDTFATYLDEWSNLPGECPMANLASECPMKETAKEAKEQPGPSSSSKPKTFGTENEKTPAEQLRLLTNVGLAVGESFLSQLFDPLVNMQAKTDKPTSSSSGTSSGAASPPAEKTNENVSQVPEETAPTPKFPGEGKKLRETGNNEAASSSQSPSDEQSKTVKVFGENVKEGWILLNKSDRTSPSSDSASSSVSNGALPKQVQPSAPAEASTKPIYPKLVMEEKPKEAPIYHPNPTIQKSVESMIQMGFSNEGGWLTNLLISKGGDIAAALDALSPVRR